MLENYEIIDPNRKSRATATTWNEAVDKAVELSLAWGVLFRVRRMDVAKGPFQRERQRVLETSMEFIEIARKHPKSIQAQKAQIRFQAAKRKLDTLMQVNAELQGSDFLERHAFAHPIKGFRTNI